MLPELVERIRQLPDRPGIYIFRGEDGSPLYVGKAKSLRKRVPSYTRELNDPRLRTMVGEARDLEVVLTDTEAEALLIENNWIKTHRPRFNILLRDDKTYPYIKLTVGEEYPRIAFTRQIRKDGATYFGPFLPGGRARKAIKLAQKLFQVRVCRIPIDGKLPRPCLYHPMKRCLGPCVEGLTTREEYRSSVEEAGLFLGGKTEELKRRLRREMVGASEELEFERAARLRDTLLEVSEIGQRQNLSSVRGEDIDVFGYYLSAGNAVLTCLVMRGGQVLDRRELFWEGEAQFDPARLLSEVLPQIYERTTFIPREIHLPIPIEGEAALEQWLSERKGTRVYVRFPSRGAKAQRVKLAMRNSQLAFRRRFRGISPEREALIGLARHLDLAEPPSRIEGFDISHSQGKQTVASLVVFEEGKPRKADYRSFNIQGLEHPDDYQSLHQAVFRRYRRILDETGVLPDLILIDGGRGQLNSALEALAELGVEETPVVSLAKREEEIYLPSRPQPLSLPREDLGLRLLQSVRDESHRFALAKHRARRKRATLVSRLDQLAGIGPKRRRTLLTAFGSLRGIREGSCEDLQKVLGAKLGEQIYQQLHSETMEERK